ncbi:hypothetical protein QCA50_006950 [Cerrena zonata]|uniref:Cytochrome c oxidase assembly protein COX20, mitochondrial n=1 Tax=Cerrena zonata TaxID=2478898 RepID=A0AAW0G9G8_9APHY
MSNPETAPIPSSSSNSKRPIFQTETTGSYWGDLKEAFKRVSFDDFNKIGEIPCARNSLLSGIASGVGIGAVRAMSTSAFAASNWALGTFVVISLGTWQICQKSLLQERTRVQQVVEQMPKRFVKSTGESPSTDSPPSK